MLSENYVLLRQSRSRTFAQNGTYFIVRRFSSNPRRRQSRCRALEERKGIMLFGKFQIYMPNAGFVGVRHREYTKVCDSAFLFRASSRAAGRRSNSKDNTVNGFMCMSNTRAAGVGHSRKAELIKQRYFHSMPYAGKAGVRHRKEIALNRLNVGWLWLRFLPFYTQRPRSGRWGSLSKKGLRNFTHALLTGARLSKSFFTEVFEDFQGTFWKKFPEWGLAQSPNRTFLTV